MFELRDIARALPEVKTRLLSAASAVDESAVAKLRHDHSDHAVLKARARPAPTVETKLLGTASAAE